jgi:hypothetical protein
MTNLRQSAWDHEILYVHRSSKGKQLLVTPLLQKLKIRTWRAVEGLNTYLIFWRELMNRCT